MLQTIFKYLQAVLPRVCSSWYASSPDSFILCSLSNCRVEFASVNSWIRSLSFSFS